MKLVPEKSSLRSRIAILCIVIAVTAVLLVGAFQYLMVPRILRENAGMITRRSLETVSAGLDQRIDGVLGFASTFVSNAEISSALTRANPRYTYSDATLISTVFRLVIVTYENTFTLDRYLLEAHAMELAQFYQLQRQIPYSSFVGALCAGCAASSKQSGQGLKGCLLPQVAFCSLTWHLSR